MSLRRPAAHLRRAPSWRRSGDESYWESFTPQGEDSPRGSRPQRPPRPQSAVEGRQLDGWLEHLQRIESELHRSPHRGQSPAFSDWTTSTSGLDRETSGRTWRQPSFSRGSSSCGSPSLYESSLGSQESLQTGFYSTPERRGSWERAHMMQAPKKEQAQLCSLAPVKIGWLPIQRRVMMVGDGCNQNQGLNHSAGQVKLKEAITPKFLKNRTVSRHLDGEVEKSHSSPSAFGVKTWQTPDRDSPSNKQVPEKRSFPANEGPVGWHALRRGWNTNRVSALPGGSQSNEPPTGTGSVPDKKTTQTSNADPHRTTNSADKAPLHRTGSVQPVRATVPHIQTSSAVTTLVPQNKAGFSSITISSRKVNRSASLPGSDQSGESPLLPPAHRSMEPNSRQVTVQRKATIVKVTEQRTTSSSAPSTKTSPASHALDTVVHRRKATIIKVTEHRESYSTAKAGSGTRHPEFRQENTWSQHNAAPSDSTNSAPDAERTVHRSILNVVMRNPPAITAPEVSPTAAGQRSDRPKRPLSCYGNMFGHTEPSEENATQPTARKWSFGLPLGTSINPANRGQRESLLPENAGMRASPSLTLIKAPDPHSHQSQEEVLALNAAAIIANIKLQRQLSKKKTPNSEKESAAPPQGNTVTDEGKRVTPHPDQRTIQNHNRPHVAFEIERSPQAISLQDALQRSRPDFITRSQGRLRELERRAQERKDRAASARPRTDAAVRQRRAHGARCSTLNDNLFKARDRAITGKEMQPRSKRTHAEMKTKKEEEKKKEACLSNRQRVELFKKKLLDQILHRS